MQAHLQARTQVRGITWQHNTKQTRRRNATNKHKQQKVLAFQRGAGAVRGAETQAGGGPPVDHRRQPKKRGARCTDRGGDSNPLLLVHFFSLNENGAPHSHAALSESGAAVTARRGKEEHQRDEFQGVRGRCFGREEGGGRGRVERPRRAGIRQQTGRAKREKTVHTETQAVARETRRKREDSETKSIGTHER